MVRSSDFSESADLVPKVVKSARSHMLQLAGPHMMEKLLPVKLAFAFFASMGNSHDTMVNFSADLAIPWAKHLFLSSTLKGQEQTNNF